MSAATRQGTNFESTVRLPPDILQDLLWWHSNIETIAAGPVFPPVVSLEITTDSSLRGWGAWCATRSTGGAWGKREQGLHINVLELKAIVLAVQCFAATARDTTVAIRTDNTTTMHCVNNFGSLRSQILNGLSRDLWAWAFARNVFLRGTYLPGVHNERADALSRADWDHSSYSLQSPMFDRVAAAHGPFEVDLFADCTNYKVTPFLSWERDPLAYGIDAFSYRWDEWTN